MNKKARNATMLGLAAGLVLVPIIRAVIRRYGKNNSTETFTGAPPNRLFSAYRGKFKPHRRKATDNGVH
jgi:hypothetical protein